MKIKYLPASPKSGITEHVDRVTRVLERGREVHGRVPTLLDEQHSTWPTHDRHRNASLVRDVSSRHVARRLANDAG